MKKTILILSTLTLLGGCASSNNDIVEQRDLISTEEYRQMLVKEEKKLNNRLAKSALLAAESQKKSAEINNGLARPMYDYDKVREARFQATHVSEGMGRTLDIEWDGPVEPILITLIKYAGYTPVFKGKKPVQSRDVTLLPGNISIKEHLDNIDVTVAGYINDMYILEKDKKVVIVYENF